MNIVQAHAGGSDETTIDSVYETYKMELTTFGVGIGAMIGKFKLLHLLN